MSAGVFAAVLFSAFFQAGWNFFAKKSKADKIALLAVGWFFSGLFLLPFALWSAPLEDYSPRWLLFIFGSGAVHAAYMCFLGWAYTIGEISVVYPVARGLGIIGTTLASLALGLHGLSVVGASGIAAIATGTLLIGLKEVPLRERRGAFFVAALVALTVSTYSVIDSLGSKEVPNFLYIVAMFGVSPLVAAPWLALKLRSEIRTTLRSHKLEAAGVALAGAFAYAIILWAYQRSPASYVAALREFSVVIAAVLGVAILKERLYKRKIAGILLILAGAALIKLA